jgi:hypothetical protein
MRFGKQTARLALCVMLLAIGILAGLTIILGVWPELGLKAVKPAVDILVNLGGI